MTILIVYVDDIILIGDASRKILRLKVLAMEFEIKELRTLRYFLGMEIAQSKEEIAIAQMKYILDLLNETGGFFGCKNADTPMDSTKKLN